MRVVLLPLLTSILLQNLVGAQLTAGQESRLYLWGSDASASYGDSLDLHGDVAIVGDTQFLLSRGRAHVIRRSGILWPTEEVLTPTDLVNGDRFGGPISYDGTKAIIGATGASSNTGAVYVFTETGSGWVQEAKIVASDGAAGDLFGSAISLDGDTLAIGAREHGTGGAEYIYVWDGIAWTEQAKLTSADIDVDDRFGGSAHLQGDRLVVGAYQDMDNGFLSGSAYVFERSGTVWGQITKLLPSDGSESDFFGISVALDGNLIAVGASGAGTSTFAPGAVYMFRFDGIQWSEEQKVTAFDQRNFSNFGGVALQGNVLVVGASNDGPGRVFVFDGTGGIWIQRASIQDWATAAFNDHFGASLSISGDTILAGEPQGRVFGQQKGTVGVIRIGGALPSPARIYVDKDASPGGSGDSWATAYDDLHLAVMHAAAVSESSFPVGEVWVAEGVYKPTTSPFDPITLYQVRGTSLHGGFSGVETTISEQDPVAYPTILSGDILGDDLPAHTNYDDNSNRLLELVGTQESGFTISGLTFVGADVVALKLSGGPLIRDCTFTSCGRGLEGTLGSGPEPVIERCSFLNNHSFGNAPGLFLSSEDPTIVRDCLFEANYANGAQGAALVNGVHLIRCIFVDNEAHQSGGAIYVSPTSVVQDCSFLGNIAGGHGGAIHSEAQLLGGNDALFVNCEFSGNQGTDGGAAFVRVSDGAGPTFVECSFSNNMATRNGGAIIANGSSDTTDPILRNCVLWGNIDQSGSGELSQVFAQGDATFAIDHSCVEGWTGTLGGVGNTGADPMFADPLGPDLVPGTLDDDYRLLAGSSAIDTGNATFLPADVTDQDQDGDLAEPISLDLDGNSRIISLAPDMGAYEYACLPAASFCDASDGSLSACPCGNAGNADTGCDIQQGTGGVGLCVWGQETSPQNALTLRGSGFSPMGSPAVIVIRSSGLEASPLPFGDGLRCLSTPLVRLGATIATNGVSSHELGHGAMAGTGIFYYQLWFRNTPSAFCTPDAFNLSNGRVVTW